MLSKHLPKAILAIWALGLTFAGASMMRAHWVPLPSPESSDPAWAERIRTTLPSGEWRALHILKAECACSQRILRYLAATAPDASIRERIIWVSEDSSSPSSSPSAYELEVINRRELAIRYGVQSSPMLLVLGPDGRPRYSGGYTARKQGPDYQDRAILAKVKAGQEVPPLPVYGCPIVSDSLEIK